MDAGTGTELLFDALVEPDVDNDGLGDESQDPDGGGLGLDWEDDWFEDFEEGDEFDEDASPRQRRQIRLLVLLAVADSQHGPDVVVGLDQDDPHRDIQTAGRTSSHRAATYLDGEPFDGDCLLILGKMLTSTWQNANKY